MKKKTLMMMTVSLAAASVAGLSRPVVAAEAEVGVDFASSYVFRGGTLNDGFVAQPYVEVAGIPGLTLGVWANADLEDGLIGTNGIAAVEGGHVSEVDLYAGYDLPLGIDDLGVSVGYTEYTYPRGGDADREVSLSLGLEVPLSPSLGVYYGIDGAIEESLYAELGIEHEEELEGGITVGLSAALGYVDPDEGKDGLSHAQVTGSIGYGPISASVTYIAELDDDILEVGEDVVGTIGFSHSF